MDITREIEIKEGESSRFFEVSNDKISLSTLEVYYPKISGLTYIDKEKCIMVPIINNKFVLKASITEYTVFYADSTNENVNIQSVIVKYFQLLYSYKEICHLLAVNHNYHISVITLKRTLKNLGLRRKNCVETPVELLVKAMIEIQGTSGFNLGYRSVWLRLKSEYQFTVKRDTVLKLLRIIDPEGIEARSKYRLKRRQYCVAGPNHLWHVDGHDKLKKFGFAISGCVDGYSRKVIWLNVASTNNNPEVIAYYYLHSLLNHKCVPSVVRSDKGTENTCIELMQIALRFHDQDSRAGYESFLKGKSTANERIEKYWKQLRNHMTEFYIRFFKKMQTLGEIDTSNNIHIECLRFCFGYLIQCDLDRAMKEWNNHRVRQQNNCKSPCGIPDVIYYWPEKFHGKKFIKHADEEQIKKLIKEFTVQPKFCSPEIELIIEMVQPGLKPTINLEESYVNYKELVKKIEMFKRNDD